MALIREYVYSVGIDLAFQKIDEELESLPGLYAPPQGRLLLAITDDAPAGGVGLRPLTEGFCEMKRLYVKPEFRGLSLGPRLAQAVIDEARCIGYTAMRLDSLPTQSGAQRLYARLGFYEIPPCRYNPIPGSITLELAL